MRYCSAMSGAVAKSLVDHDLAVEGTKLVSLRLCIDLKCSERIRAGLLRQILRDSAFKAGHWIDRVAANYFGICISAPGRHSRYGQVR
jgi:hypothetical protein